MNRNEEDMSKLRKEKKEKKYNQTREKGGEERTRQKRQGGEKRRGEAETPSPGHRRRDEGVGTI